MRLEMYDGLPGPSRSTTSSQSADFRADFFAPAFCLFSHLLAAPCYHDIDTWER